MIYSKSLVVYIGGFPEISGGENLKVNLKLNSEKLLIEFFTKKLAKDIKIEDIIDAECSTEEQISKDITLGRLIVFGALAFGLKKNNKITRKYAVITYKDEFGKQRSLVFETYPDELIKNILDLKRIEFKNNSINI
jgi:hypothetical protein